MEGIASAQILDESGAVIIDDGGPVFISELDLGQPAVRAQVDDRPGRSGSQDSTQYFGARSVSAVFWAESEEERRKLMTTLSRLVNPARRPYLSVLVEEWGLVPWRMKLRADQFSMPLTFMEDLPLIWQAPDGVLESTQEIVETIFPSGGAATGRTYPRVYPYSYGNGSGAGAGTLQVDGTAATPPIIRIFGPVQSPKITNQSTGQSIEFKSGYQIPAGEYISIDIDADTITANDDPSISRLNQINFATTDMWQLQPGENIISLTGFGFSGITQATLTYRERRL